MQSRVRNDGRENGMMKITLTESDREFFALAADAAFTNPFSEKREQIDRHLAGTLKRRPREQVLPVMMRQLRKRLDGLDSKIKDKTGKGGAAGFSDFEGADRELIKYVYLFDVFHRFAAEFDGLIQRQLDRPDSQVGAEFVPKMLDALNGRGFDRDESVRQAGLFYQLRRAYYFIDKGLIGQSECMRGLRVDLWNNIFTSDIRVYEKYLWDRMEDFSTLLEGPTGSGKGAAAAAIGLSGYIPYDADRGAFESSFVELFVSANLSQVAPGLMESELFGHSKGAFTGAVAEHEGLFGLCRPHGTIFLDEIGEVSEQVQVKLLKVLEERAFTAVGSHKARRFSGRIVAATNRRVEKLLAGGTMREDFYYRLCSDVIKVPSLRQRIEENPAELAQLVRHFVRQITGHDARELCDKVMDVIGARLPAGYQWRGNVRELAQCIRRVILKEDYSGQLAAEKGLLEQIKEGIESGTLGSEELLNKYCLALYQRFATYQQAGKAAGLDWRTVKKRAEAETGERD